MRIFDIFNFINLKVYNLKFFWKKFPSSKTLYFLPNDYFLSLALSFSQTPCIYQLKMNASAGLTAFATTPIKTSLVSSLVHLSPFTFLFLSSVVSLVEQARLTFDRTKDYRPGSFEAFLFPQK